jgi:hypothetical protein
MTNVNYQISSIVHARHHLGKRGGQEPEAGLGTRRPFRNAQVPGLPYCTPESLINQGSGDSEKGGGFLNIGLSVGALLPWELAIRHTRFRWHAAPIGKKQQYAHLLSVERRQIIVRAQRTMKVLTTNDQARPGVKNIHVR